MKILIVEDELPAAERLRNLITEHSPQAEIDGPVSSVNAAIEKLKTGTYDLVFLDIHLADGHSFEIFKEIQFSSPVIFVTAFDQYALDAFKHNGIEYLLKPLKKADLQKAMDKYTQFFQKKSDANDSLKALADMITKSSQSEKKMKRLMVRYGSKIKMVDPDELAFVISKDKISYLTLFNKETLPSDFTMDELENSLDEHSFFRINRQMLVNLKAVDDITVFSKSRLKLSLSPTTEEECLVSAEKTPAFKAWLTGKN